MGDSSAFLRGSTRCYGMEIQAMRATSMQATKLQTTKLRANGICALIGTALIAAVSIGTVLPGCGSDDKDNNAETAQGDLAALPGRVELVRALGGEDFVANLSGARFSQSGSRYLPHEGVRPSDDPVLANTFTRTVAVDVANDFMRLETNREVRFLFPAMESFTEIVRGNLGTSTQAIFGNVLRVLPSDKLAAIRMHEMLLSPHLLFKFFDQTGFTSSSVTVDGAPFFQLTVKDSQPPINLFVNATTGELTRLETLQHDFYRRDVTLQVYYSGWQSTASGVSYPTNVRLIRDSQFLLDLNVSNFEPNPTFAAGTFDFPADSSPEYDPALYARGSMSPEWYYLLDSIGLPFSGIDTAIVPVAVPMGAGVWQLQGGTHHSFVVEQADGLVLVDAPLYQDRGKALFDYLAQTFPGKAVRYVVASHFHEDHVSGIREVLGSSQASLVVQAASRDFWQSVLTAPSTLMPDALARAPRTVEILTVPDGASRRLDDAQHPVTLYHMATQHAADMLLTHEGSTNTAFVVDIYSPGNMNQIDAVALNNAIVANSVPTANLKIVGGHGTAIDSYATLQTFLPQQ
jgi:glyoxylase-like metal-dependent hydrolase (beta-lactamase superfamily II)